MLVDQYIIMLVVLVGYTIPPKMKQGGKKKPVKIEENCGKSVSPDWYVLLFVD
jgi:hypothetical protein